MRWRALGVGSDPATWEVSVRFAVPVLLLLVVVSSAPSGQQAAPPPVTPPAAPAPAPRPAGRPRDVLFRMHLVDSTWCETVGIADFNRDGRLDLVSCENWYEGPASAFGSGAASP